jgi:hypothetical protein
VTGYLVVQGWQALPRLQQAFSEAPGCPAVVGVTTESAGDALCRSLLLDGKRPVALVVEAVAADRELIEEQRTFLRSSLASIASSDGDAEVFILDADDQYGEERWRLLIAGLRAFLSANDPESEAGSVAWTAIRNERYALEVLSLWFTEQGWQVGAYARGVDLVARRHGESVGVEVIWGRGVPPKNLKSRLDTALGTTLRHIDTVDRMVLAFPDRADYVRAISGLEPALMRLGMGVLLVRQDGSVRELLPIRGTEWPES